MSDPSGEHIRRNYSDREFVKAETVGFCAGRRRETEFPSLSQTWFRVSTCACAHSELDVMSEAAHKEGLNISGFSYMNISGR